MRLLIALGVAMTFLGHIPESEQAPHTAKPSDPRGVTENILNEAQPSRYPTTWKINEDFDPYGSEDDNDYTNVISQMPNEILVSKYPTTWKVNKDFEPYGSEDEAE